MSDSGTPPDLGALLQTAGFELRLREDAWWDCLLSDPDAHGVEAGAASWTGHGASRDEAVGAAFRAMVPSRRARRLLMEGWTESAVPDDGVGVQEALEGEPEEALEDVEGATSEVQEAENSPKMVKIEFDEAVQLAVAPEPEPEPEPEPSPEPRPAPLEQTGSSRRPIPVFTEEELEAGLAELGELRARIHAAGQELAELSPRRIQLALLGWIAEARSYYDRFPGQDPIRDAVYHIAQGLQHHAARLWPGSVPALQISQTPRTSAVILRLPAGEEAPSTWAALAERTLDIEDAEASDPAVDDEGWADSACLEPTPTAPENLLAEIHNRLVKLTGPLYDAKPEPGLPLGQPGELRGEILELARKLRWLRGATLEPELWGRLMGRLRCIAQRFDRTWPELGGALDPESRPPATWAAALGQDPLRKQRQRQRREVLVARPLAGATSTEVRNWLLEAFEALDNPDIIPLLDEVAEAFDAIDAEQMPDSRLRKRLRRLREKRDEGPAEEHAAKMLAEAADATRAARARTPDRPAATRAPADPHQQLREQARRHTRGQVVLFVSNRKDPELQRKLTQALQPEKIEWCAGSQREVESRANSVRAGSFGVVIAATGFLSHKTDAHLMQACRAAGVGYVRAFKGRELACLRAVVRDLGQ